jgi:hypothetical protein
VTRSATAHMATTDKHLRIDFLLLYLLGVEWASALTAPTIAIDHNNLH